VTTSCQAWTVYTLCAVDPLIDCLQGQGPRSDAALPRVDVVERSFRRHQRHARRQLLVALRQLNSKSSYRRETARRFVTRGFFPSDGETIALLTVPVQSTRDGQAELTCATRVAPYIRPYGEGSITQCCDPSVCLSVCPSVCL